METTTADGCTALHLAADNGNFEATRWLVYQGVDTNVKNNKGLTALDLAEGAVHKDITDFLQRNLKLVRLWSMCSPVCLCVF